ncbi:MAG: hypothetical protein M3R45_04585 [Pseudomonadota bacterium]|nr:hypothetical protein [Pseudomonadota bacterium]
MLPLLPRALLPLQLTPLLLLRPLSMLPRMLLLLPALLLLLLPSNFYCLMKKAAFGRLFSWGA